MEDLSLTPQMLALVPLVAAAIQVIKNIPATGKIKPFMPFIGMIVAFAMLYAQNPVPKVMPAIFIGLVASGAYDSIKAISKKDGRQ